MITPTHCNLRSMCGRYALHASPEVVRLQFGLDSIPGFAPRYNIAPATPVLVVKKDGASFAHWGFRRKTPNLRAESSAGRRNRCLMPASGFYEWKRTGKASQPYYIRSARDELLALAAIWDGDTCAVITAPANRTVSRIHDRMPVLIEKARYEDWLAGEAGLLETPPDEAIVAYPVSAAVNRAANESPALIEPAPSRADLFGE
jgi:putative SOS response-associated peptidase YedK